MKPIALGTLAALALLTSRAAAQHHLHGGESASPTPAAEIQQVKQAVEGLSTTDAARAAGFNPVLGWIPTMGTHWVSAAKMLSGKRFDPTDPPQLMFSPVDGQEKLVGAAFAYLATDSDSARPATFAGNPPWHEHPDLAPPGMTLVMLHVWFVDSPDGPFAGHNPWLPFWALGLTPPDAARLHDPAEGPGIRAAAIALSEVVDSSGVFPRLAQRPAVQSALAPERTAIRALVPELDRAQHSGDWTRWTAIAGQLADRWRAMRRIYLGSIIHEDIRARAEKFLDEMETGGHH